jgi:hypothetical protein
MNPKFELVTIKDTKPIDHEFEGKKYRDERLLKELPFVQIYITRLIESGVDPNGRFSRAVEIFNKYGV